MDKRRKKVLVVTQYFWPEELRVNELVSRLVLSGFDVDVVTGRPNYPDGDIYRDYENAPNKFRNYCGATIYRVRNSARGKTKVALLKLYHLHCLHRFSFQKGDLTTTMQFWQFSFLRFFQSSRR